MSELQTLVNKKDVRKSLIMIKPLPLETITKSGIYLDFMSKGERIRGDQPVMGIIKSAPEIFKNDLPKGAKVIYSDLDGGYFAEFEGEKYFFTHPKNIFMVVGHEDDVQIPIYGVTK